MKHDDDIDIVITPGVVDDVELVAGPGALETHPAWKGKVRVVPQDEAEDSSFVVCVFAGQEKQEFKGDNIYTTCAECGSPITHRPHAPKKPKKLCVRCASAISPATREAIRLFRE